MKEDSTRPQIDSAKIRVGSGIAGAIFTIGSMLIFLFGIPVLRYVFPAAILLGCAVALVLRFVRHKTPGTSWILSATDEKSPSTERCSNKEDGSLKTIARPIATSA
jgi:hypothetical protein